MNKLLIGSVALAAIAAGPAMAADMPLKAPPPMVSYYDWTGVYIGASIGGVWSEVNRNHYNLPFAGFPATTFTSKGTDTIWDIHLGAQQQWGWFVLGVEAGYSAGFKEMSSSTAFLPTPPFVPTLQEYNKITNLFTVEPRLGVAWDRWMIYGTGGWATASVKTQYTVIGVQGPTQFAPLEHGSTWLDGWFAGGGAEYMIYKGPLVDAIVGVEYQHFDLSTKSVAIANLAPVLQYSVGPVRGDIVRARLTIKTQGWRFMAP